MTAQQEEQITHKRLMGDSCGQIARSLNISVNTVKSFCRRHNLRKRDKADAGNRSATVHCGYCGAVVKQAEHRKRKKFCSDVCRAKWWKEHRHLMNCKSKKALRCAYCGGGFFDYASAGRKYCSHECYIADRFGDGCIGQGAVPKRKTVPVHHESCESNAERGPYFRE